MTAFREAVRRLRQVGGPVPAGPRDSAAPRRTDQSLVVEATGPDGEFAALVPEDHDRLHQETAIVLSDRIVDLGDVR